MYQALEHFDNGGRQYSVGYSDDSSSSSSTTTIDDIKNLENMTLPIIVTFADNSSFIGPIWTSELESVLSVLIKERVNVTLIDRQNNLLDEYKGKESSSDTKNISWR